MKRIKLVTFRDIEFSNIEKIFIEWRDSGEWLICRSKKGDEIVFCSDEEFENISETHISYFCDSKNLSLQYIKYFKWELDESDYWKNKKEAEYIIRKSRNGCLFSWLSEIFQSQSYKLKTRQSKSPVHFPAYQNYLNSCLNDEQKKILRTLGN